MAKRSRKTENAAEASSSSLKGWRQIAEFLGQPVSVAQRWARTGMPVTHDGRRVAATAETLTEWLGREAGSAPVHVATPDTDLSSELKRGLSYVRRERAAGKSDRQLS